METGKVVLTAEELKQMMQECADEAARKTTANLGNGIGQAVEQYLLGDMKRVKLPIPEEYGGGSDHLLEPGNKALCRSGQSSKGIHQHVRQGLS